MAGSMVGADSAQLRALAQQLTRAATELQSIAGRLTAGINATAAWQGGDATRFRGEWNGRYRVSLRSSSTALTEAAQTVRHNADQQDEASGGSSSPGGVGSGGAPGAVASGGSAGAPGGQGAEGSHVDAGPVHAAEGFRVAQESGSRFHTGPVRPPEGLEPIGPPRDIMPPVEPIAPIEHPIEPPRDIMPPIEPIAPIEHPIDVTPPEHGTLDDGA